MTRIRFNCVFRATGSLRSESGPGVTGQIYFKSHLLRVTDMFKLLGREPELTRAATPASASAEFTVIAVTYRPPP